MKKAVIIYRVSVKNKPGHGGRRYTEEEAIRLKEMLEKEYKTTVRIIKEKRILL